MLLSYVLIFITSSHFPCRYSNELFSLLTNKYRDVVQFIEKNKTNIAVKCFISCNPVSEEVRDIVEDYSGTLELTNVISRDYDTMSRDYDTLSRDYDTLSRDYCTSSASEIRGVLEVTGTSLDFSSEVWDFIPTEMWRELRVNYLTSHGILPSDMSRDESKSLETKEIIVMIRLVLIKHLLFFFLLCKVIQLLL